MSEPLNPSLYAALQLLAGGALISNAGVRRVLSYAPRPDNPTRLKARRQNSGEQYRINCPFCGDQRHRLYVSYFFGQYDQVLQQTDYNCWFCQNETHCHQSVANRARFRLLVSGHLSQVPQRPPTLAQSCEPEPSFGPAPAPNEPIELPSDSIPLCQLPENHPAVIYLLERGFDVGELSRIWDVRYVPLFNQSSASNRILIPIGRPRLQYTTSDANNEEILVSWQARFIGTPVPPTTKYVFPRGFTKSKVLYGLSLATQATGPVLVVEGVTDVWRAGPGAVATFGKQPSHDQLLLLRHHFVGRPIVVVPDADAREEAEEFARELFRARGINDAERRVVVATLHSHASDPAECTRQEIWDAAAAALA